MKTSPKTFVSLLLGLILLAAACGSSSENIAATINGSDIAESEVQDEIAERRELFLEEPIDYEFLSAYEQGASEDGSSADIELVREVLSRQILFKLIEDEVVERGGVVSEDDAANARTQVEAVYPSYLDTPYHQREVTRFEYAMSLSRLLAEDSGGQTVEEAYAEFLASGDSVCASHILVETLDEANEIIAAIAAGALFEDIAFASSLDPGSGAAGGDLGCSDASRYVPTFAAATIEQSVGEVGPPVESDFGFHIIRVDARPQPLDDELRAILTTQIQSEADGLDVWIRDRLDGSEISVNDAYGIWDAATGRIIDPLSADSDPES